jgi:hypothetical protein
LCRLILISFRVGEEQREIIFVVINAGTTVISYIPTDVMPAWFYCYPLKMFRMLAQWNQ